LETSNVTKRQEQRRAAAERWMGGPHLSIPGIPADLEEKWDEPPPYIHDCHEALRDALEPWIYGTTDIPILRRILTDRQMHLRGRVSMAKTLLAINRLMDFRTCNLATPIEEKDGQLYWLGRPITFLATVAGIGYYACKDRINDVVAHFAMSRHQQTGTDAEGKPYGRPSIRNVFEDLFWSLGKTVGEKVKAARDTASRIWREAHEVLDPVVEATKRLSEKIEARTAKAADMAKRRAPEVSAKLYAMLKQLLPGYRKPKPDTS